MLKEAMERLAGAGRRTPAPEEDQRERQSLSSASPNGGRTFSRPRPAASVQAVFLTAAALQPIQTRRKVFV